MLSFRESASFLCRNSGRDDDEKEEDERTNDLIRALLVVSSPQRRVWSQQGDRHRWNYTLLDGSCYIVARDGSSGRGEPIPSTALRSRRWLSSSISLSFSSSDVRPSPSYDLLLPLLHSLQLGSRSLPEHPDFPRASISLWFVIFSSSPMSSNRTHLLLVLSIRSLWFSCDVPRSGNGQ